MSEFSLNFDDFSSELDALSEVVTGPTEGASHTLSPRARICAGNAATLMLAAIYEEYIRQQVISAFKEKCSRVNGYTDLPKSLAGKVWKKRWTTWRALNSHELKSVVVRPRKTFEIS